MPPELVALYWASSDWTVYDSDGHQESRNHKHLPAIRDLGESWVRGFARFVLAGHDKEPPPSRHCERRGEEHTHGNVYGHGCNLGWAGIVCPRLCTQAGSGSGDEPPAAPFENETEDHELGVAVAMTRRFGAAEDAAWIGEGTRVGRGITAGVPPEFEAYATVVIPTGPEDLTRHENLLLAALAGHASSDDWWLGYLETGSSDVVFPEAPRVRLYAGWSYVLVEGGPAEARSDRSPQPGWHTRLPDLMFPRDRGWLATALWDDDWWCVGGARQLVDTLLADAGLEAREVRVGEDATPPGHVAR